MSDPTRLERIWRQPRGKVGLIGGAIVVIVLLALAASQLPRQAPIAPPEATATSTTVQATATPSKTVAPSATPTVVPPTPTSTTTKTPPPPPAVRWEKIAGADKFAPLALNALAVDPNNPDTIFAGTYGAGVYISRDGGQTWAPSNEDLGKGTVGQIAVHPKNSNIVYAALFDQGGIYKSIDGGRAWQAINAGIALDDAWNWTGLIYLDPNDSDRLFFADTTSGLYLSANGGESWHRQNGGGNNCPQVTGLVIDPADNDHLFAVSYEGPNSTCRAGVYESTDAGIKWTRITTDEMIAPADQWGGDWWHLAADPRDLRIVYAGGQLGTYKSSDGGKTWKRVQGSCQWLAVHPDDGAVYCGQGAQVQVSRDGGASWSVSDVGGWGGQERFPFAFAAGTQILYAGNDAVMKSTDGGRTWRSLGQLGAARKRLIVDPRDGNRLFLSQIDNPGRVYLSTDGGEAWQVALDNVAPGGRVAIDPVHGVVYYPSPAGYGVELYRSLDDGATWARFGKGQPTHSPWQILPDPQDPERLWLAGECGTRPAISDDGGTTFTEAKSFQDELCQPIMLIDASGRSMYIVQWGAFYRSTDGGATWRRGGEVSGIFRSAALNPSDPGVVYLGSTHRGMLKSIDSGLTWSRLSGLAAASVSDIAIDQRNPQTVYAATDAGAFVTLDGGETWNAIGDGLGPNPIVYSIGVDPDDSAKVYAVTPDGIFRLVSASTETAKPLNRQAEQARAFAEPILQAIANRPPDFEDDFSAGGPGWTWDDRMAGQVNIVDGVMQVNGTGGHGIFPPQNLLRSQNFVFEFDARLKSRGDMGTFFRQQKADVWYGFFLYRNNANGYWRVNVSSTQTALAQGTGSTFAIGKTDQVRIIARGKQFAVYLNGQPIAYFEDATFPEAGNLMPTFAGESGKSVQGEFDNFKFWNLDNVPGLP